MPSLHFHTVSANPRVSVVIPAYRSGATIGATLQALAEQDGSVDAEILVVRTGEDDGTDDAVRRYPRVKLIGRQERLFAGAARNLGAGRAAGEILAFLDSDCRPGPGWLLSLVKGAEHGARAQGGSIETLPPKTICARAEELLETIEFHPRGKSRTIDFASAANCAYDESLFHSAGGFPDAKLGEDMLLGEKIRRMSIPIAFNPEMAVLHDNPVPVRGFFQKQVEHGIHSALVRRRSNLRGSLFVRRPLLLPLLAPARLARIGLCAGRIAPSLFFQSLVLSPVLLLGVGSWTWGFFKGSRNHAG